MASIGWYRGVESLINKAIGPNNRSSIKEKSYLKRNVLVTADTRLLLWLESEHAILSLDVSRVGDDGDGEAMKLLLPSSPPVYNVTSLVLSEGVSPRLALLGTRGVNVVQLPTRPTKPRSLCSSVEIGERMLMQNPHCEVLGAKWHPASPTHLLVLLSNNNLRVWDCDGPYQVHTIQLGPPPVFRLPSGSYGRALGETAVDFDLGQPTRRAGQRLWPLFVLRGNGDVYSLWLADPTRCSNFRYQLQGPLSVHPPAEDNYGAEACSLLCLAPPQGPPLLVIATSCGMVYHCVALEEDNDSNISQTSFSLYVYESLELEVSGREPSVEKEGEEEELPPIRIFRDTTTVARYHCCHSGGVHTVALPLLPRLQSFAHVRTGEEEVEALSSLEEHNCVVEHVVCTKPLATSVSTPVIGLAIISGVALGGTTLLVLLADYELLTLPLAPCYLDSLPRLLLNEQGSDDDQWSELSQVTREPFDQHVRRLLQRRNSNPIYKSEATTSEPLLKDCLNLLNKSTRILREEYIQKLDLAHETIQERIKVLQDLKTQQLAEIDQLNANKVELSNRAEHLAERYEELKERQEAIVRRVENVLGGLLKNAPMLSDAEKNMKRELLTIEEKFKHLKNAMQQIRTKQSHHSSSLDRHHSNNRKGGSSAATATELQQIKDFLVQETNSLTSMANQLKQIQLMLNL